MTLGQQGEYFCSSAWASRSKRQQLACNNLRWFDKSVAYKRMSDMLSEAVITEQTKMKSTISQVMFKYWCLFLSL